MSPPRQGAAAGLHPPSVVLACGAAAGGEGDAEGVGCGPKGELGLAATLPWHPRVLHPQGRVRHAPGTREGALGLLSYKQGVPPGLGISKTASKSQLALGAVTQGTPVSPCCWVDAQAGDTAPPLGPALVLLPPGPSAVQSPAWLVASSRPAGLELVGPLRVQPSAP